MKIIRNPYIPFKGFKAFNFAGILLFVRGDAHLSEVDMNHENIHSAQWKGLWYIGTILLYCIEWIIRLFEYKELHAAYRNISLEREAYANQSNLTYLETRKRFSFIKYL